MAQGQQWAGTFIEASGDGPECFDPDIPEPTPGLVKSIGTEYSDNETLFYNGFADTWNEHVAAVGGEVDDRPWWQKIF